MKLYAPISYWEASSVERSKVCNGCGAKGGINVPDTFYGLSMTEACDIHDWMWEHGITAMDKMFADAMFMLNMTVLVLRKGGWLTIPRLLRASKYYIAVVKVQDHYWENKSRNLDFNYITYRGEFK